MARMTQRRKIHRFHLDGSGTEYPVRFKEDVLAAEEPLEIRIGGRSFAVTMRTPGTTLTWWQGSWFRKASSPPTPSWCHCAFALEMPWENRRITSSMPS